MIFLDGVYINNAHRPGVRFRWVKAPTSDELTRLTHTIAQRVARYLEHRGLLASSCSMQELSYTWHRRVLARFFG